MSIRMINNGPVVLFFLEIIMKCTRSTKDWRKQVFLLFNTIGRICLYLAVFELYLTFLAECFYIVFKKSAGKI
ncbi:hypothetical protein N752_18175 [Desulforamulus aquiferis]|nr:hypothetical protein N752_18175 [Desulforamulus aquiferis]